MAVQLVVFDMAGTTVDDAINGVPLMAVAIKEAFKIHGLNVSLEEINKVRGMEKKEAIKSVLEYSSNYTNKYDLNSTAEAIFIDFEKALNLHLTYIDKEIPETSAIFKKLRLNGVKISVGSGFPESAVKQIVKNLNWDDLIDLVISSETLGHGRPNPAMIYAAMSHFNIKDVRTVVKVGDTRADVQEGKNAGCWTIAVLTGTQSLNDLKELKPDFIINSVADLFNVITQINQLKTNTNTA